MINFDGKELQEEFNRAFGNLLIEHNKEFGGIGKFNIKDLTLEQLWWLVKFAKHVRGRCRNNAAFNNFMNRNFAPARFTEIDKTRIDRDNRENTYNGLKITVGENSSEGGEE
jgi:hypothetical protein